MSKIFLADKQTLDETKALVEQTKSAVNEVNESVSSVNKTLEGGTGGGIAPSNMLTFWVSGGDKCAKLTIVPPEDTVIDNQMICTVAGVKIVRSDTKIPNTEAAGIEILDLPREEFEKYKTTPYVDEGLTNNKTYYYKAFPYSDYGICNRNPANGREVTPKAYILYGFKRDKNDSNPATRISYTEMAVGMTPARNNNATKVFNYGSWKDVWLVSENKPAMIKYDGTIDYYLNPNDYTKKENGEASDVSNQSYGGNAMAIFPHAYIKRWQDTRYEYVNFCNIKLDEDYYDFAHQREDESSGDWFAYQMFDPTVIGGKMRSIKGTTPTCNNTATSEQSYAKANGAHWDMVSHSRRQFIMDLCTLISCHDSGKTAFGRGYYTGATSSSPNWLTSGGAFDKGQFYGSDSTRDYVKVFHIENFWGNVWNRIVGHLLDSRGHLVRNIPPYNFTGTGYDVVGVTVSGTNGGYIKGTNTSKYGTLSQDISGSETTYTTDGGWVNNSQLNAELVGGSGDGAGRVGLRASSLDNAPSSAAWTVAGSLSSEQPVAA